MSTLVAACIGQNSALETFRILNQTRQALITEKRGLDEISAIPARVRAQNMRRRRWAKKRGVSGRGGGSVHTLSGEVHGGSHGLLLVLGIITNPRTPHTREWIRSTYKSSWAGPQGTDSRALIRFVLGRRGLNADDQRKLAAEQRAHSDLEYIDASDFADRGGTPRQSTHMRALYKHVAAPLAALPTARGEAWPVLTSRECCLPLRRHHVFAAATACRRHLFLH